MAANKIAAQEAVPIHFEDFTINDGLSQGFVTSIVQDKQGFMWFGTNDGLNKYDGYTFTVFRHDPANKNSLAGDDITCLFEDSQRRLWVGIRGKGIDIYDRERNTFRHIRQSGNSKLRSGLILSIYEDRSGAFWINTREGIDRLEFQKDALIFTAIHLDSSFEHKRNKLGTEGFLIDKRNRKFITTNTAIAELIFNDSLRSYKVVDRFRFAPDSSNAVGALMEDTLNHCIYLNSGKVIYKFADYNFTNGRKIAPYEGVGPRWTMDQSHYLWLMGKGSITQVNTRYNRKRSITADNPEQLKILQAATLFYTDRTGVIWIGSGGYGLIKYDPATAGFHHIMRGANIYQILEDKEGKVITNNLNALTITEDSVNNLNDFVKADVIREKFNMTFTKDTAGNLWFARSGVLLQYQTATKTLQRIDIPFTDYVSLPFPLLADRASNIWMGYNRYLVKYDWLTKKFFKYDYPATVMQYDYDFLQSMYQDEDLLWLGSINGLLCFDTRREKIISSYVNKEDDSSSISNNVALSFCSDIEQPDKYLWIGTKGGGLNRLDKSTGKFIHFSTVQGLSNNVVYGILPDYEGNLWLSTNKGLAVFNIVSKSFRNFDVSDGLQSNEFNRYAYLRTSEGIMVFGGLNGINYFRSDEIRPLNPPKVVFTDFRLFNKSIIPSTPGSPLQLTIDATEEVRLKYEDNVVTFQFAATDYRKKGSIRYRYQMEGFDKDWTYSGTVHEATYTNLDPGKYRFIVQASFENGEWSTDSASVKLYIITPWYRTWWFYALVTLTISAGVYTLYRYRLNQVRRVEGLRNRIARDLHDEVGSSISTIAIYSKIVQEQMGSIDFDKEPLLNKINDFATEIMGSMNDIVWSINTKNDAFEHIISRMREQAIQLFEAQGSQLHFHFDETILRYKLGMERRREFYLIYKEALNNIAKYATATNVWISMTAGDNRITLKIRDDGKGFDSEKIRKGGNGLNNMQQRATALQGKISIQSKVGGGTEITLSFVPF